MGSPPAAVSHPPHVPDLPFSPTDPPHSICSRPLLGLLLGGQLLSLLITGTGVFSQLLAESGVRIPTSQSFLNYVLLSLFLIPHYLSYRQRLEQHQRQTTTPHLAPLLPYQSTPPASSHSSSPSSDVLPLSLSPPPPPSFLSISWYWYLLLALCDVEGNYLLVTAYQYTTITSIQLLDCFTIPIIMTLSFCLFRQPYTRQHVAGALVCLLGMALLIFSDQLQRPSPSSSPTSSSNQLIGDLLVLLGCCCYAVSNLGQERIVKAQQRTEFLAMMGAFGALVSAVQIAVTEREALQGVQWSGVQLGYVVGFSVCLYALYLAVPLLLQISSALFFNLSILTSDFWSVLFAYLLFSSTLHPLYFVAFTFIIIGLTLYNLAAAGTSVQDALRSLIAHKPEPSRIPPQPHEAEPSLTHSTSAKVQGQWITGTP